ncbi:MAG TPA: efflux RND transporter periplasmic adaptor subunit [Pyrinomonadaceae bacterium]
MSSVVDEEVKSKEPDKELDQEPKPDAKPVLVDQHGKALPPEAERAPKKTPLYRRPVFLIVAIVIFVVLAFLGIRYWLHARSHETTDDAFIDAHVTAVSPKVGGYVTKVYIQSNQQVNKGDLLAEIDPRDFEAKLEQAKAALSAGQARLREARTSVDLTRVSSRASVQQASATVQQARAGVAASRAQAASDQARSTQASATINTARANVRQAQAQLTAAEAELTRAHADVLRYQQLFEKDEVSRQRLDQAIATERTAEAQVRAAQDRVGAAQSQASEMEAAQNASAETARKAQAQIHGAEAQVREAQGRLAQANTAPQQVAVSEAQADTAGASIEQLQAAVDQAELELSYTKIYAPDTGRVTNKSIEEGALIQVGQPLMAIVPGDVWVTANFKENQIGLMHPGQSVEISVDAYPDKTFKGHVDSLQAGTGARFSLLPAENATGNYVKVVQRIPVKIVFDEPFDPNHLLAPGMSVVPEVKVR